MNRFLNIQTELVTYKKSMKQSTAKSGRFSFQKKSGLIAVGWKVIDKALDYADGDIKIKLDKMEGYKYPNDNKAKYVNNAALKGGSFTVKKKVDSNLPVEEISVTFRVNFKYNGHAVGEITIEDIDRNDAIRWGVDVKASIMPTNKLHGPNRDVAAVEVAFHYRFHRFAVGNDIIKTAKYEILGNGGVFPI